MSRGLRRPSPALIVACVALFASLAGTVYAGRIEARKVKIEGRRIKLKSMPGNRLALGSVHGNRLKPGTLTGSRLAPATITGQQVDASTLGQVPSAAHADSADSAHDAETALHAVDAVTATAINGHGAGCRAGTRPFAGACWQTSSSEAAVTAPAAAESCAVQGGELPEALALAAFSQRPNIALDEGGEWTSDLTNVSGLDAYAVITISSAARVNFVVSTETRKYRCVIPLVT
jgi:hypothetical protein